MSAKLKHRRLPHRAVIAATLASIAVVVSPVGCAPVVNVDPQTVLVVAVEQFHSAYNNKDFDGIYGKSFAEYRSQRTREAHRQIMSAFYSRDGKVINTEKFSTDVTPAKGGTIIVGTYTTMFEHGFLTEGFAFRYYARGGRTELMHYVRDNDSESSTTNAPGPQRH